MAVSRISSSQKIDMYHRALTAAEKGSFETAYELCHQTDSCSLITNTFIARAQYYQANGFLIEAMSNYESAHFMLMENCADLTCYTQQGGSALREGLLHIDHPDAFQLYLLIGGDLRNLSH